MPEDFAGLTRLPRHRARALAGFFEGDRLQPVLGEIADAALDFPAPTTAGRGCPDPLFVLELFHGPTAAFKDFGARFLAESAGSGCRRRAEPPLTILVATSGDTGGAVAAAFHRRPWVRVVILYPKGLVSPRQEQQLTCWGDNVSSLRIDGTFDDCQGLVKEAFVRFTLEPQAPVQLRQQHQYRPPAAADGLLRGVEPRDRAAHRREGRPTSSPPAISAMPSPRSGRGRSDSRSRASSWRTTSNRTVPDFLRPANGNPRPASQTLASAMDVGNPSNMERIRALYPTLDAHHANT